MFGKKHETSLTLYSYGGEETNESTTLDENTTTAESTSSSRHCAWCGDPPDENGSHGICAFHEARILEQSRARRRNRS